MDRRHPLAAAVLVAAVCFALTGCGVLKQDGSAPAATTEPAADSGFGESVKDSGDIPDPCHLLSEEQVTSLTGREVTQVDEDGEQQGATTRFCQWQQSGGQVALFLSRTTEADFRTTIAEATPVDGVGEEAFQLAGHLYVLYGTVSIDVYSRGDSDEENLAEATAIAKEVIPQV